MQAISIYSITRKRMVLISQQLQTQVQAKKIHRRTQARPTLTSNLAALQASKTSSLARKVTTAARAEARTSSRLAIVS